MHRTFRITVDGRAYHVVVEDLDQPTGIVPAPNVAAPPTAPVVVAPAAPVAPPPDRSAAPPVADAGSILAPLAGVVFSIDVPLGHHVAVGDKVATIEAMKMKTEVHAKIAGKVLGIAVKTNESVETGQLLMTLG